MKALVIFCLVCMAVSAQVEQATVTGVVTDPTGAAMPGALVTARNTLTGVEASTRTTTEGIYRIPYLQPGTYHLTAEAPGFQKARVAGANLTVGLTATFDITMAIGAVQSEVIVTANAVL